MRNFRLLLSILCAVGLFFSACQKQDSVTEQSTPTTTISKKKSATVSTLSTWMSQINDNVRLSEMSIPGSHETCATNEPFPGTAKCQNLRLSDQFPAGIRYIDIRCRHYEDAFVIHHGSVYQNMNFDDVLNDCWTFLAANPSECIIMSVKEEYDSYNITRTFEQTFDAYVAKNPSGWYLGSSIPTLGSVRGKIVLLRRFGATTTPKGLAATGWSDNTTFSTNLLRVQDYYAVSSNDTKWTYITNLLSEAKTGSMETLYLNYTSGYKSILGVPNIGAVGETINPKLTTYFTSNTLGRYGVIIMDYVDAAKSLLVVNTNFFVDETTYKIINLNSGKALDVYNWSTEDGGNVNQWTYSGGACQLWKISYVSGGYYKVINVNSGKSLDVYNWGTTNGTNIQQWTYSGGACQLFQISPSDGGTYRFINKNSRLAMEVVGSSSTDGANVDQWAWWNGSNQRWTVAIP